tara:strand:+ start:299 stop:406 length:108 start_codon:yes stop_codon:yes gene_type:complete
VDIEPDAESIKGWQKVIILSLLILAALYEIDVGVI